MHVHKASATPFFLISSTLPRLQANRSSNQAVVRKLVPQKQLSEDPNMAFLTAINAEIERQVDNATLGIKELMVAVHLSHSQLFRRLKAITGMNPTTYIRTIRLQKANRLVLTTDWPIAEIAYSLGFTDPNYFSRAFRKHFGYAPRAARRKR